MNLNNLHVETKDLSEEERRAVMAAWECMDEEIDSPFLTIAFVTAAVALNRWGCDLKRDDTDQQYGHYRDVLLETSDEILSNSAEQADTGQPGEWQIDDSAVDLEGLVMMADQVTELIESRCNIDRHHTGELTERLGRG